MQNTASARSSSTILHELRTDFEYYAPRALKIIPKSGQISPFVMNQSQRYVHEKLEEQLDKKGRVRALIVKGRQQGLSTYAEGRFTWKMTMNQGIRAFTVASESKNTKNLFEMSKTFYNFLPQAIKPALGACNGYEMVFPKLQSSIRAATAGGDEVGRGLTISHLHGSEVAYWDNGSSIIASLFQAVPDLPNTEIILESTAAGPVGIFHKLCRDALDGINEYEVIFCPWFWEDGYRLPVDDTFVLTQEEVDYMTTYDLDINQMAWRRNKIATSADGLNTFRQEYPATVEEAFSASVEDALWTRDMIRSISEREFARISEEFDEVETVVAYDPAGASAKETNDESGIVVATLMSNDIVYIREDASGHYNPQQILPAITNLYWDYDADRLTIEVNGVGDWLPTVFKNNDQNIVIHQVRAKKGKRLRAMPVANAYSDKRVVHVRSKNKSLEKLEAEMCSWNQSSGKSPNRIDALVYAVVDLLNLLDEKPVAPYLWASQD